MKWKSGRMEVESLENITGAEILLMVRKQGKRTVKERKVHQLLMTHPNAAPLRAFVSKIVANHWDGLVYLQSTRLEKEIVQAIEKEVESARPLRFVEEVLLTGTAHFFHLEDEVGVGFRTYASHNVIEVVSTVTGELAYLLLESVDNDYVHVIWVTESGFSTYKGDSACLKLEKASPNKAGSVQKVTQSFHHRKGLFAGLELDVLELCRKGKSEKKRGKEVERIQRRTVVDIPHRRNSDEPLANWQMIESLNGYQVIQRELNGLVKETLQSMADFIRRNDYPDAPIAEFTLMLFKRQSIEDEMLWNPKSKERDMLMYFGEGYERYFLIPPAERQKLADSVVKEMNRKYPRSLYRNQ